MFGACQEQWTTRLRVVTAVGAVIGMLPQVAWSQTLRESPTPVLRSTSPRPAPPATTSPAATTERIIPVGEALQQTLTRWVLAEVPREYENTKKWGGTKRIVSGLDWELDGLKVETRRQYREANHGSWSRYRLALRDTEQFQTRLENLCDRGDNTASCDLVVQGNVDCFGRIAEWRRGVQLISLSAEGTARVTFQAHVETHFGLDLRGLPPDIVISPRVTTAELKVDDLRLTRVGQADGPLVRELSDVVERGLDDYLAEYRTKLVEKLNQQIEKKRDHLRIPLSQLTSSPWGTWFQDFLKPGSDS
jgi:hypothetical protein